MLWLCYYILNLNCIYFCFQNVLKCIFKYCYNQTSSSHTLLSPRNKVPEIDFLIAVNFTCVKESPLFSSHGHPFKCPVHRTVPIDFYLYKFLLNGHLVQGNNQHITKKDKHFNRIM